MDDQDLLRRIRAGDESAFDALFRATYGVLVGVAFTVVRRRDLAEEIVQDVLLEVWKRRETLRVEESARGYLARATRNRALNHLRHQAVERRGEPHLRAETSSPPSADAGLREAEIAAAVERALDRLPDRCREVFELSRKRGLSYAEIAAAMEISVKTVEAQMGKALRILREELAAWLE